MRIYILQRILSLIPVLFIVAIVVFFIVHLTPGDPASVILGAEALPEEIEQLREQLGINVPIYQQFFEWFTGLFVGDLGWSIYMDMPVLHAIISHLGPTLNIAVFAQIIAIVIALPFGIIAATKRGTSLDQFFMIFAMLGISIPSFLLGLLLILMFAVQIPWFPVAGYETLSSGLWNHLKYLVLPAVTMGAIQAALIARMTRSSMLDVLNMNFIKTARAKGLKEVKVIYVHALRNAFIPILTVIGQTFGTLIAGTIVVETVFNLPGIGQLVVNSISRRDYPMIQGIVLMVTCAYVLVNLIVDLLYGVLDPRVRLHKK